MIIFLKQQIFLIYSEAFGETNQQLQQIAAETTLVAPDQAVDTALQLVEQRKRRADDVKRRAADSCDCKTLKFILLTYEGYMIGIKNPFFLFLLFVCS